MAESYDISGMAILPFPCLGLSCASCTGTTGPPRMAATRTGNGPEARDRVASLGSGNSGVLVTQSRDVALAGGSRQVVQPRVRLGHQPGHPPLLA
jgi:hypothetical protein